MLVDEQFRKCAAFLVVDSVDVNTQAKIRVAAATAFLVGVPTDEERSVVYAVTARHVVEKSRAHGALHLRLNLVAGGAVDLAVPQDEWIPHPTTDVAILRVALPEGSDIRFLPLPMLATDEYVEAHQLGVGDDVFFVGLFSPFPGLLRNQPIVRFGTISLMPHETIPLSLNSDNDLLIPTEAYLVEARSWGGHSGSPCFIVYRPDRTPGAIMLDGEGPALLGLVHGHYEIPQDVAFIGDIMGSGKVPVNAGMAVVIPAKAIISLLMGDDVVEERQRLLE